MGTLKSLFWKSAEPEQAPQPEQPAEQPSQKPGFITFSPVRKITVKPAQINVETAIEPSDVEYFHEQLNSVLQSANLPKPDYLDLRTALDNMESLPMDEATKFKAAYATMKSSGCKFEDVVESFDYYNGVLNNEKSKFDEALESSLSETVLEKQKSLEKLERQNTKNAAEIKRLTEESQSNQNQIETLSLEIAKERSMLDAKKAAFTQAFNVVAGRLVEDLNKVKTYLNGELQSPAKKIKK